MLIDIDRQLLVEDLDRAGVTGVGRYLTSVDGPKRFGAIEGAALSAAGIACWLVYEDYATQASAGSAAGQAWGKLAVAQATDAGVPSGAGIYFAGDWPSVLPGTRDTTKAFADVVSEGGFRPGWYGRGDVGQMLLGGGVVDLVWEVSTWQRGDARYVHLVQLADHAPVMIGHVAVDFDVALAADFGQFPRPGPLATT